MKNADLPAMPNYDLTEGGYLLVTGGLTKREYFAGLAMQGLCAHSGDYHRDTDLAQDAVMYADALLAELERTK